MFMSVVYFSLLLFVRIEQNIKIFNILHFAILHRKYIYNIIREKLFSLYPENTYLFVCGVTVHGATIKIVTPQANHITPQTFSIQIVNKQVLPQTVIFKTKYCSLSYAYKLLKYRDLLIRYRLKN